MPKINGRRKGKRGEREFLNLLGDALGKHLERNLNQSASGGCDCVALLPDYNIAIEVKRCETLSVPAWWRQATKQAKTLEASPVLAYRQNKKKWQIVVEGDFSPWEVSPKPTTIDFDSFVEMLKAKNQPI